MTTPHTPRTQAPSAVSHTRIAPAADCTRIRLGTIPLAMFSVATLAVIRFIQKASRPKPARADLPNSLYAALHEFNPPQRPS